MRTEPEGARPETAGPATAEVGERLRVRVRRVDGMPVVNLRIWLRGGARLEDVPGQALVTGRLLSEGSRRRTWERIATEAEDLGMLLSSTGTHETIGVSIDTLAAEWERAVDWLAELCLEPVFPEERCDWIRRQAAAELDGLLDQPEVRTGRAFLDQLYQPHPYSRPLHGSRESLERLTDDDCRRFHRQALAWGGLVVVTGDLDESTVEHRLRQVFAALDGPAAPLPAVAAPCGAAEPRREITVGDIDQAHLYLGHLTLPRHHPDATALELVGVVLGAGACLSGRLPERIRDQEGLAYNVEVATAAGSGLEAGRMAIYVGTSPRTLEAAERSAREELERLVDSGITDSEFLDAQSFLLGREPFRRETARQWADLLAETEFYGLPSDRPEVVSESLRQLEREQVEAVARRWIRPQALKLTIGRPAPEDAGETTSASTT